MTDTIVETIPDLAPYDDTADGKDHKTHIVNPPANQHIWELGMDMKDVVYIARMNGYELVALCGYRWVPRRDPAKYDTCQECLDIAMNMEEG